MTTQSHPVAPVKTMGKIAVFRALMAASRDPNRIGDVAVYKSELSGARASSALEAQLRALDEPLPAVATEPLFALPTGTLGREYAEFLRRNDLRPFRVSDDVEPELLRRNVFIVRYSLLHDVFHVLTGFDTSWAGEAGVWGFVVGQRYRWTLWLAIAAACIVYPMLSPRQTLKIWRNAARGIAMGRKAAPLLPLPLEHQWDQPVAALRTQHRIELADSGAAPARAA